MPLSTKQARGLRKGLSPLLDRLPASLDLACPGPDPPGLRLFLSTAPKDRTARGPTLRRSKGEHHGKVSNPIPSINPPIRPRRAAAQRRHPRNGPPFMPR
ncbi:hypothetical protein AGR1B_pAt30209 [Agrobacterium fabacearum S56]|nr:hypothetical protein AGR1B_pAt30209 [Agrobacterium fabacearum S56]